MFVAERFVSHVVNKYGLHQVSSDGSTWYPQACKFLNLLHHLHSSFEKSIIERTIPYIKDRTENFDDYFPCKKNKCKLNHIKQWLKLFVYQHNKEIKDLNNLQDFNIFITNEIFQYTLSF